MRIALVVTLLLGCGSKPPMKAADPVPPAPVAAHEEACYAGSSKLTMDGVVVAELPTVAKRTLDPATSTITEDLSQVGERGVEHYAVEMKVTGSKAELKETGGAFTGTVELVGEPWKWNEWTTTANLPNGMRVTAKDTRDGNILRATKEVVQNDKILVTMTDELTKFDCAELEAKQKALVPKL